MLFRSRNCWVRLKTGQAIHLYSNITTAVSSRHRGEKVAEWLKGEQAGKEEEIKVMEPLLKLVQSLQLIAERLERLDLAIAEDEGEYTHLSCGE